MKLYSRFQSVDVDKNHSEEKWHLLGQQLVSSSSQWTPRPFLVLQNPSSYWTVITRVKTMNPCQSWTFMRKWNHRELYQEEFQNLCQKDLLSLKTSTSRGCRPHYTARTFPPKPPEAGAHGRAGFTDALPLAAGLRLDRYQPTLGHRKYFLRHQYLWIQLRKQHISSLTPWKSSFRTLNTNRIVVM
ncbi:hypothetical protein R6Z07F_016902 [Ovis aries]